MLELRSGTNKGGKRKRATGTKQARQRTTPPLPSLSLSLFPFFLPCATKPNSPPFLTCEFRATHQSWILLGTNLLLLGRAHLPKTCASRTCISRYRTLGITDIQRDKPKRNRPVVAGRNKPIGLHFISSGEQKNPTARTHSTAFIRWDNPTGTHSSY